MALFSIERFMGDDDDIEEDKQKAAVTILEKIKSEAKQRKGIKEKKLHTEIIITEKSEKKKKRKKKLNNASEEDNHIQLDASLQEINSSSNTSWKDEMVIKEKNFYERLGLPEQSGKSDIRKNDIVKNIDLYKDSELEPPKKKVKADDVRNNSLKSSKDNEDDDITDSPAKTKKRKKEKGINENVLLNTPCSDGSFVTENSASVSDVTFTKDEIENEINEDLMEPGQWREEQTNKDVDGINENLDGPNEIGGFTLLGEVKSKTPQKVQRKLPDWLANPSIITVDLKHQTQPVCDMKGLDTDIVEKLQENGITHFFPVQRQVIPAILDITQNGFQVGKGGYRPSDLCISAPTGSGKTLAFVLPIIQALKSRVTCQVRALAVLPVRDLAVQVYKVFQTYCKGTRLKVALITGQKTFNSEQQSLVTNRLNGYQSQVDIIVATPGRLVDHINKTEGFNLSQLRFLVIDEADRMMEEIKQDWLTHVENAVYHKGTTRKVPGILTAFSAATMDIPLQKLLFSATLSQNPEKLQLLNLFQPKLFTSVVKDDKGKIYLQNTDVSEEKLRNINDNTSDKQAGEFVGKYTTPEGLTEYYVECTSAEKPLILLHLLHNMKFRHVLCFTNSVESTHRLFHLIKSVGDIEVREFSSGLHAARRSKIVQQFTNGKIDIIICSDAMARGMDVDNVRYVISYDSPSFIKTYIHRVGRTARAGKAGTAITLLQKKEFYHFKKMTKEAGKPKIKDLKISKADLKPIIPAFQEALKELPQILKGEKLKRKSTG